MRRLIPLLVVLTIILCSCRIDLNLNGGNYTTYADSHNWMGRVADSTRVTELVIPGTHDTCANYDFLGLSSVSATQDLTLSEQLNAGVRCLDIRICEDDGVYKIHHGVQFMHMTLDDVISICKAFLQENPTEFIVLTAQGEYTTPVKGITQILESYITAYPELFLSVTELGAKTISEVRGKIIPVLRYSDPSRTRCLDTTTYNEKGAKYKTTDPEENFNRAIAAVEETRDGAIPDNPTAIYFACYFEGQFGIPNIRIASSSINPRLQSWLSDYEGAGQHLGMLVTDHMTKDLAHAIYSCNILN